MSHAKAARASHIQAAARRPSRTGGCTQVYKVFTRTRTYDARRPQRPPPSTPAAAASVGEHRVLDLAVRLGLPEVGQQRLADGRDLGVAPGRLGDDGAAAATSEQQQLFAPHVERKTTDRRVRFTLPTPTTTLRAAGPGVVIVLRPSPLRVGGGECGGEGGTCGGWAAMTERPPNVVVLVPTDFSFWMPTSTTTPKSPTRALGVSLSIGTRVPSLKLEPAVIVSYREE